MDYEIYKLLIQFGGSAAIIVAIIFLLKEVNQLLNHRNNNNIAEKLKKLENNELHEIRADINYIQQQLEKLNNRVTTIETTLKIKHIMKG